MFSETMLDNIAWLNRHDLQETLTQMQYDLTKLTQGVTDVGNAVTAEGQNVQAIATFVKGLSPDNITQAQLDDLGGQLETSAQSSIQQGQALTALIPSAVPAVVPVTDPTLSNANPGA